MTTILDTPLQIHGFRMAQWRGAVRMEAIGLRHSSGRSVSAMVRKHFKLKRNTPHVEVILIVEREIALVRKALDAGATTVGEMETMRGAALNGLRRRGQGLGGLHGKADSGLDAAAKAAARNWRRFDSFAWFGKPDNADAWGIFYTQNRDSSALDQSNHAVITAALRPYNDSADSDVREERHSHWAVGWVDGFAIRIYAPDGSVTAAFRTFHALQKKLEDYPVLDEEDFSRREYEDHVQDIKDGARRFVRAGADPEWPALVFSWLYEHAQDEVDDASSAPSDASLKAALRALHILDPDHEDGA